MPCGRNAGNAFSSEVGTFRVIENALKSPSYFRRTCRLSLRQIVQHAERLQHRLFAHLGAADIAEAPLDMDELPAARSGREMHEPDRLFRAAAVRPGDAGHRDREIDRRMRERAARHFFRGLAADRAMRASAFRADTPSMSCLACWNR